MGVLKISHHSACKHNFAVSTERFNIFRVVCLPDLRYWPHAK